MTIPGTMWPVVDEFWGALVLAAAYPLAAPDHQRHYRSRIAAAAASLDELADSCPENFRCFSLVVRAEQAVLERRARDEVVKLYDQAITYAGVTSNLQQEALANDLCGRRLFALGDHTAATEYLSRAYRAYAAWGALAKLRQIALAQGVVRYVRRTQQDVIIADAASDERFGVHVRGAASAQSILCLPVAHQGRMTGLLYLEHGLTGAFTAARTEMVRVLAAQAAIAFANAQLYEGMKSEIDRRAAAERALREALAELETLKNRLEAENVYLQEEIETQHNFNEIVGNSPALLDALHKVERVAPTGSIVLLLGETGSGKELFARAVHSRSTRNDRPLVKVNCGAIPPGLVESELFGHVKGAFTGAIDKPVGRFEVADGGTIFLDEIGELPLEAQVKLLRVLQEQEFEPVGSSRTIRINVRIIAATNRKLEHAVREGRFRADLLYRLNVFPIDIPPLRERPTDIPLLVSFFLSRISRRLGKPLHGVTARSMEQLQSYTWPGNVRELQNVLERAAILTQGHVVNLETALTARAPTGDAPAGVRARGNLADIQREHILNVLKSTGGIVEGARGAAIILGIHPNTLRSRMKKLGISPGRDS